MTPAQFALLEILTNLLITTSMTIKRVKNMEAAEVERTISEAETRTDVLKARMDSH